MPTVKIGTKFKLQIQLVPLSVQDERHLRAALALHPQDAAPDGDPRTLIVRALEAYTDSTWAGAADLLSRARAWSKRKAARVLQQIEADGAP